MCRSVILPATLLGAPVRGQNLDAQSVPTLDLTRETPASGPSMLNEARRVILSRARHRFLLDLATNVPPIDRFVDFTNTRSVSSDDAESTWASWIVV
jgi:hypothetical protein